MRHFYNKVTSRCSQFFQPIFTKTSRRQTPFLTKTVITTVVASTISLSAFYVYSEANASLSTIYHVYVKGDRIGAVSEKTVVENVINQRVDDAEEYYSNYSFTTNQVSYIPEKVFNPVYNNEMVVKKLEKELSILAEAVGITIGDETVVFVKSEEDAENVIRKVKEAFVSEKILKQFEQDKDADAVPNVGESIITDVRISKKVSYTDAKIFPRDVLSVENAVELIQKGTLERKIHTVKEGEVLGKIASNYDLSVKKMLKINPDLTEDSVLQIGDEINVTAYEPLVNVVVEEKLHRQEKINYETEVVEDGDMFKGDSKVKQKGKKGEKKVIYEVIKVDGEVISKQIVDETIIQEPVKKIVVKGTKVIPSRGTGDLAWPAVGGSITSPMGYRWGRMHKGIDIAGGSGTIQAADNGVVTFAGWDGDYGNKVVINHNNGMRTIYAHLKSISVKKGQTVQKGKKIGVMGTTGRSTGVHLHFEVYKSGKLKNPRSYY